MNRDELIEQAAQVLHQHGACTCEELSGCLDDVRQLADAGLLRNPAEADEETVEQVQAAIVNAHNEFQIDGDIPHWGKHLARAALRALNKDGMETQ